ncbi:MAG: cyclic nucleotide-binding domain-containing protein [Magnetococcales bacterium]|nr:cyclic nucleotide-binding domain-containing protein [Magnetococcales bacterium]
MQDEITLEDLIVFLSKTEGFKDLSRQDVETLIAPVFSIATFEVGQIIIHAGKTGRNSYFLYRGRVRVDLKQEGQKSRHFFIEQGELFGEVALVSKEKRNADVVAATEVVCLAVEIETFQNVMANHWQIAKAVAKLIGERKIERLTVNL